LVAGVEGEFWWSGRASSIAVPDSALLISSPTGTTGFNLTLHNRWSSAVALRAGVFQLTAFQNDRLMSSASIFACVSGERRCWYALMHAVEQNRMFQ